jgi:hypothetical protein
LLTSWDSSVFLSILAIGVEGPGGTCFPVILERAPHVKGIPPSLQWSPILSLRGATLMPNRELGFQVFFDFELRALSIPIEFVNAGRSWAKFPGFHLTRCFSRKYVIADRVHFR